MKELQEKRGCLIEELTAALIARDQDVTRLNTRIAEMRNNVGRAPGQLEAVQRERFSTRTVLQLLATIVISPPVLAAAVVVLVLSVRR